MLCPDCGQRMQCFETRQHDAKVRRRKYRCVACETVWHTKETFALWKKQQRKAPKNAEGSRVSAAA